MHVRIICPAKPGSRFGNRITALRWQRILTQLGHRASISEQYSGQPCDALVALHARRSASSVQRSRQQRRGRPIVVAMTGTDLYRDIRRSKQARESLRLADRLILLQEAGLDELTPWMRDKACVIYQSASPTGTKPAHHPRGFRVIVLGHLRHEKDPLRGAMAVRKLPASSRILVDHYGAARDERLAERAVKEMQANTRYRWLGELPRWQARRRLARSRLLLLSSRMEGGANVLSEALADNVPVIASRISGSVGILGDGYAGFFPVSDTLALRELLLRAETDRVFLNQLSEQCQKRSYLVEPDRERDAWRQLLRDL